MQINFAVRANHFDDMINLDAHFVLVLIDIDVKNTNKLKKLFYSIWL